jgi:hypothetical protein
MRHCVSVQDGSFKFTGLPAGAYSIQVDPSWERPGETFTEAVEVVVEAGQISQPVRLEVATVGMAEITVKGRNGSPLVGASVFIKSANEEEYDRFDGTTDANGIASIKAKPGEYRFGAKMNGYHHWTQPKKETFQIDEEATTRLTVALSPLVKMHGTVNYEGRWGDGTDNPKGARIFVFPSSGETKVVGADGHFEITAGEEYEYDDPYTSPYLLVARHPDKGFAVQEVNDPNWPLDFSLEPGVTVTGKVTDSNDNPIAGASVGFGMEWRRETLFLGPDTQGIRTDANGQYVIRNVPTRQTYTIGAGAKGYGGATFDLIRLHISGQSEDVEAPTVELVPTKLDIAGTVVDLLGNPVPGARVTIPMFSTRHQPMRLTTAGKDGKFILKGVMSGDVVLDAYANRDGLQEAGQLVVKGGEPNARVVIVPWEIGPNLVKPAKLLGSPVGDLSDFGLQNAVAAAKGKKLLLCFWDYRLGVNTQFQPQFQFQSQFQSRSGLWVLETLQYSVREKKKDGIVVLMVHANAADEKEVRKWTERNRISYPVGMVANNLDWRQLAANWGVVRLPWLILTDSQHNVVGEGLDQAQLDELLWGRDKE